MEQYPEELTYGWYSRRRIHKVVAIIIAFIVAAFLALAIMTLYTPLVFEDPTMRESFKGPMLFMVVLVVVVAFCQLCASYLMGGYLWKVFPFPLSTITRVVENCLIEKKIKYRKIGPQHSVAYEKYDEVFELVSYPNTHIKLHVGPIGTAIWLGKISDTNKNLIDSLQLTLDKAFVPKGI